jgi:hypothetical protein
MVVSSSGTWAKEWPNTWSIINVIMNSGKSVLERSGSCFVLIHVRCLLVPPGTHTPARRPLIYCASQFLDYVMTISQVIKLNTVHCYGERNRLTRKDEAGSEITLFKPIFRRHFLRTDGKHKVASSWLVCDSNLAHPDKGKIIEY